MSEIAKPNTLKTEVVELVQRWHPDNINDLINMLREKRGIQATVSALSTALEELRAEGRLDLEVPYLGHSTLVPFLRDWRFTKDFWSITAGVLVLDVAVLLPSFLWLTPIRWILGTLAILFFPGYSVQMCLFPDVGEMLLWKRILLGIGLSVALAGFYAIILDATTQGIVLGSVIIIFTLHTLIFSWIGLLRRFEARGRV